MREIKRVIECKKGNAWETTLVTTDEKEIYKDLAMALVSKKLHQCTYIKSIKDHPNYDGTRNITVYYDNGVKSTYTIESR